MVLIPPAFIKYLKLKKGDEGKIEEINRKEIKIIFK